MREVKRLISLPAKEASKIRKRQLNGTMSECYDDQDYLCYYPDELAEWSPRKVGRKPKKTRK